MSNTEMLSGLILHLIGMAVVCAVGFTVYAYLYLAWQWCKANRNEAWTLFWLIFLAAFVIACVKPRSEPKNILTNYGAVRVQAR